MARGWESKSVEEQIEDARERRNRPAPGPSPEEIAKERKRDSFLLQRTRVQRDIANCRDARYKATLSAGLAYIEEQLAALNA
jgi:hypothetical protein